MLKTPKALLVNYHTPGPWTAGSTNGGKTFQFGPKTQSIGEIFGQAQPQYVENIKLVCAAPELLKVAQKMLLWMEDCLNEFDFNHEDENLYDELRQAIRAAGGFSCETHWCKVPYLCYLCGHTWSAFVEVPIECTYPTATIECERCHMMSGEPA